MRKKVKVLRNVPVLDYAAEGKSLSRIDGKVVFIEGAIPGDEVDVFLKKNKKDWAEGRAINFHKYSEDRIDPFCEHFGVCGGCKWQMLPYEMQTEFKQREVAENLKRIGKVDVSNILPIIGADKTRFYRNKLEFTFSNKRYITPEEVASGKEIAPENALGFHVPKIFDKVIDINKCHLQEEPSNLIRNTIREFAAQKGYSYYDIKEHTGWLRTLIIRLCSTGELMVNVCFGHEAAADRKELFDHLLKTVPQITTLLYTINPKFNDSIFDLEPQVYFGKGYVIEKFEDYQFKIGPKSFFQTNTYQGEKLYQITRDFAGLTGNEIVYDLYCGTGSIGIFLSKAAKKVIGVEVIAEAIEDAKINAGLNNIEHAEFYAGDVIDVCNDDFFAEHGRPDVIITDPPRAGMHEKLVKKLIEIAAPRIVYVSCNPATQARDLYLLGEFYSVDMIQPVDMFPHTHHIENVVLLNRKS